MLRTWTAIAVACALALALPASAQEEPGEEPQEEPGPETPQAGEEPLTPEEAMRLLEETRGLMDRAEMLLMESAAGRGEDPQEAMEEIIRRLRLRMDGSQENQQQAIERLREILRRAPT